MTELFPARRNQVTVKIGRRVLRLTNLQKAFWPDLDLTKGDLLRYYAVVSGALLPHLAGRAMVMKRYPQGWEGPHFFQKRTPVHRPGWLETCRIEHSSGSVIEFPVINDLAALLWVVNLGCIDLNPWYSRCDDTDRPDFLHFDLDPVPGAGFDRVRQAALLVRDALGALGMPSYAKTTGSQGIHVYVPIVRGPTQKRVWQFAKTLAQSLAAEAPQLLTAEYRIARRPADRVLVDYNQNAWGSTLASVYSVRPVAAATVSMPVTWDEVERGVDTARFTLRNAPERIARLGDLWRPLTWARRGRFDLEGVL
jgi:bifunctional non-homologous end joining protein LigD